MSRHDTSESEQSYLTDEPPHRIPQYDTVDSFEHVEHAEHVTEMEVKSNRGDTEPKKHITIHQDGPEVDGEHSVTVIEIASKRGSSRRDFTKRTAHFQAQETSLPMPEHPARVAPEKLRAQPSPPNPEMAFDIGVGNILPVLGHKMNMNDRDPHDSVSYLNTTFFDVFAEPTDQYHSIACVWTLSFKVFEIVRIYCYKILTLIFGLLIAFIGGFLFALFAFLNIWIVRPTLLLARMAISQVLIVWPTLLIYVVRPFFYSVGAVFSTARLHTSRGDQVAERWERHVQNV